MAVIIPVFGGEVPRTSPRLLENHQAVKAINCQLEHGHLQALKGPGFVAALKAGAGTIYKHPQDGWLEWPGVVNVVKSAVYDVAGEKPLGHLFLTGERAYPTQYVGFEKDRKIYRLGLPRPEKAPDVALASGEMKGAVHCYAWGAENEGGIPARYGNEGELREIEPEGAEVEAFEEIAGEEEGEEEAGIVRSSSYCYTLVQTLAGGIIRQESAPSPPSAVIDLPDGNGVVISGFTIPELADANITHIRIYRTVSGNESGEFHFLVELEANVREWTDIILDKDVSPEVLQTSTWDTIPDDAKGLIVTNNGIYAAFRGNELLISEPGHAYAFPEAYRLAVEDNIVALAQADNTIIVLTEGRPYLVSGTEPGQMQLTHLPIEQSCAAARSVAALPGGVIYASPDGLMIFTANDQSLASGQTFTRGQWLLLEPENILGAMLDDRYLAFFAGSGKGFIFTAGARDIVRFDLPEDMKVTAVYHHSGDDCVYLAIERGSGHGVWKWEGGDELEYVWRSKPFFSSRLAAMTAARVEGGQNGAEPALVNIYANEEKKPRETLRLRDTRTKRLKRKRAEKLWSVELRGRAEIYEVRLGYGVEGLEYGG